MLQKAIGSVLSFFFPPRCPECRKYVAERGGWCDVCLKNAVRARRLRLTFAQRNLLAGAVALSVYEGGVRDLLRGLKYRGRRENVRYVEKIFGAAEPDLRRLLPSLFAPQSARQMLAVPVPLHKEREKKRGYNQTELVFAAWLKNLGVPLVRALTRKRATRPQYGLTLPEREKNLRDAFALAPDFSVARLAGRDILLLDDIFTTGATAAACAGVLRAAGAKSVTLLALASGQK